MKSHEIYKQEIIDDISRCLDNMQCQPILFVGSGFSQRYFDAPSWSGLLQYAADLCPLIEKDFAYYLQSNTLVEIGSIFSEIYKEWAWSRGKELFPNELFSSKYRSDIYLKHKLCEHLTEITPKNLSQTNKQLQKELSLFKDISPHALITTNYDNFLEILFPNYQPIIGQKILRTSHSTIGEILKIHGCVSDPTSLVLTTSDYEIFERRKKYLSAKLLTYFAEHPLLFIGYSLDDSNIKSILSNIDEIISRSGSTIPNVYALSWIKEGDKTDYKREEVISIAEGRTIRIKTIEASDFSWVYEAFSYRGPIKDVNIKLLRALSSRIYEIIKTDIPRKRIEVDYDTLEASLGKNGTLDKVLGIGNSSNSMMVNHHYPHTLSEIARRLDYDNWYHADQLLKKIGEEKGVWIKNSDNNYHVAITNRSGKKVVSKYSESLIPILEKVKQNQDYSIKLNELTLPDSLAT